MSSQANETSRDDQLRVMLEKIVSGDTSVSTARATESILARLFADDERFEELEYALSVYTPGGSGNFMNEVGLQGEARAALTRLA